MKALVASLSMTAHALRGGGGRAGGYSYSFGAHCTSEDPSSGTSCRGLAAARLRTTNADRRPLSSEIRANLLIDIASKFVGFSEFALKSLPDQLDFDSAIRRFESSRPSSASP